MSDPLSFSPPQGVGIDLVNVSRIAEHLDDVRFLERLFTETELRDAGDGPAQAARLAARWAAKEAAAKALRCGLGESLTWKDAEVVREGNGAPVLRFSERARQRHGDPEALVSLSHDGDYAIAVVWILSRREGNS